MIDLLAALTTFLYPTGILYTMLVMVNLLSEIEIYFKPGDWGQACCIKCFHAFVRKHLMCNFLWLNRLRLLYAPANFRLIQTWEFMHTAKQNLAIDLL